MKRYIQFNNEDFIIKEGKGILRPNEQNEVII